MSMVRIVGRCKAFVYSVAIAVLVAQFFSIDAVMAAGSSHPSPEGSSTFRSAAAPAGPPSEASAAPSGPLASLAERLSQGGYLILIRHASTDPGVGDPPGFRLDDCSTQRNLSAAGREEARRLGEAFRNARLRVDEVRSSAWCRCQATARIAFGRGEVWAPVSSFFEVRNERAAQSAEVERLGAEIAAEAGPRRNIVLITHQVNITAITDVYPAQAEIVVARHRNGRIEVVERMKPV